MRTVLITGGSRGIGAAIAAEFSAGGWQVIAPSRSELNLADKSSVAAFCQKINATTLDALVNNAGINFLNSIRDIAEPDWDAMIQVNLTAPRCLIQAVAPAMIARGWGRIVNISSIFSLVSKEKRASYSVTKAGVNALTRTAAIELGPSGILVNAVCPGYIETDMTYINNDAAEIEAIVKSIPLRRLAKAAEIAKTVQFLCSENNTYITGQTIIADGGFTCQ
jgi:NAD(P)-dependent dehydrogenase (short-subunit alcohol dehydrogenase family)